MADLILPELGENIDEVDVAAVLVDVGDTVRRDQPVVEVETEKASLEVPASRGGRVVELLVKQGDKVRVGQVLLRLDARLESSATPDAAPPGESTANPPPAVPDPSPAPALPAASAAVPAKPRPQIGMVAPAAPSARALATQLGVDINDVPGSGPGGRISRDDVKARAKALIRASGVSAPRPGAAPGLPDFAQWGEVQREPLSAVRRATAAAMSTAWSVIPHVTQFDRAEITQLEAMRRGFNQRPEAGDRKLTVTAIAIKVVAAALRQCPRFNSSLDLAGDAVVLKKYVHVGVAVDTERGLLVPVIRDVDRKGLLEISTELGELARRARAKKITPEELRGACFTVSNLGGLGTTYFSPIVNWPEVAILGVGRAEQQAIFEPGGMRPGLVLPLSLSYDHRIIDGADAARFLRRVAEGLEQPLLLLLED